MARCSQCDINFFCGSQAGLSQCWCFAEPKARDISSRLTCLCSSCYGSKYKKRLERRRCFRLRLAYIGNNFCGFQQQPNQRSVQSELQQALKLVTNLDLNLVVAGRTDAGVHAHGQVVSLEFPTRLTPRQLLLALASYLPKDLIVNNIDEVNLGFNARRHSLGKQYVYQVDQALVPDIFQRDFSWHIRKSLDINAMNLGAKFFYGEHDFESFRSSLCRAAHAKRYIWHVSVEKKNNLILFDIRGNAFCMNMVRIMTGTLVEIGLNKRSPENIKFLLQARDRTKAGRTAKAKGLSLYRVYYPDNLDLAQIPQDARFPRYPLSDSSWS